MIRLKHILLLSLLATTLVGCGNSGVEDLEEYVREIKAKGAGKIEPLPEPRPNIPFTYTATFMRDPFQNQNTILSPPDDLGSELNKCTPPDLTRPKQFLEGFDIGSFAMVGTLSNDKDYYALLRGAGGIHRVKVGDYIGLNHGRIQSIDDFGVKVLEKIPDGNDGCKERPYTLELKN